MDLAPRPFADLDILAFLADDAACGYYRVVCPMEFLRRGGAQVEVTNSVSISQLQSHQIIYCQRQYSPRIYDLVAEAKRLGKVVIYELDDHLHAVHPGSPAYKTYRPGSETLRQVERFMRLADGLFTTTPEIANAYAHLVPGTHVLPNFLDFGLRDWETRVPRDPRLEGKLVLGWAGSVTHQDDWAPLKGQINRVLAEYPQTVLALASAPQLVELFVRNLQLPEERVVRLDPLPMSRYPELPQQFDIGLVPVVNTEFNRAKSDLKILEYGAWGVPYVASKVAPYHRFHQLTEGAGGLLAEEEGGWYAALKRLIEDTELRKEKGRRIAELVRAECGYQENVYRWAEALRTVRDRRLFGVPAAETATPLRKPGRNDKCPCGSGKKYKNCVCFGAWG